MNFRSRFISALPIICTIIFLTVGFTTGVWHPTWAIYFLMLLVPFVWSRMFLSLLYPIAVIITYIVLGINYNIWHPLWVIFLTIPVYYILFEPIIRRLRDDY